MEVDDSLNVRLRLRSTALGAGFWLLLSGTSLCSDYGSSSICLSDNSRGGATSALSAETKIRLEKAE